MPEIYSKATPNLANCKELQIGNVCQKFLVNPLLILLIVKNFKLPMYASSIIVKPLLILMYEKDTKLPMFART